MDALGHLSHNGLFLHRDPYEEITVDGTPFSSPYHSSNIPPAVRSNPLYKPDSQDDLEQWSDPHYERLTQSDEQVIQMSDPAVHGQQFDVSILLQGGSLPHAARNKTRTDLAAGLGVSQLPPQSACL